MSDHETLVCEFITETHRLSFGQLCRACDVEADWIVELVDHGIIEPETRADTAQGWHFTSTDLVRARRAARLHRDLTINVAGLALALELMDEIRDLRAQLAARRERGIDA